MSADIGAIRARHRLGLATDLLGLQRDVAALLDEVDRLTAKNDEQARTNEVAPRVAALSKENAQLRAIVDDLIAAPVENFSAPLNWCDLCDGEAEDMGITDNHDPSCVWRRAVEFVAGVA